MIPGVAQAVVEAILAQERGAMERRRRGDPMGWADISADEVTYIGPELPRHIRGLAAYRSYLGTSIGRIRYDESDFVSPRVTAYGDVAVLAYNHASTARGPGGEVVRQTAWNCTEVYALIAGRWKIIHTHWSHVRARPPERLDVRAPTPATTRYEGVLAELLCLERAAMERWRRGDPWGFAELSADEVTYFDTHTPRCIDGLRTLRAEYARQAGKVRYDVVEVLDPHVQLHGDAAVLSCQYVSTVLEPGGSVASRTPWNCTEVFVRRRNEWKIVHTHRSYVLGQRR